ncbi:hypothetical protein pneo_cds_1078 [Pandoravirus neocaledonia]|uniref:F-box domain containing protein n=1 Tax=Pandoravirus neocaledonia TaxID=2107708 RepID=A0A2U7UEA4_9VIRU|nr:hypothetical protein pneo_cds_1078 [Pandoravirus neocaledonia]AVK76685.1 hypothetical protein pneo_cds_1078 [Pandoravirus neocaledonia]
MAQPDTTLVNPDESPNQKSRLSYTQSRHDLPAEIWTLIAHHCVARDLPSLAATCTMLYGVARHRARQDALAAYASVDTFVSRWQKATAFCDHHLCRARCDQCSWAWRFGRYCGDTDASTDDDDNDDEGYASQDGTDVHDYQGYKDVYKKELGDAHKSNEDESGCGAHRHTAVPTVKALSSRRTRQNPPSRAPAIKWKTYTVHHGTWTVDWLCDNCGQKMLAGNSENAGFDDDCDDGAPFPSHRQQGCGVPIVDRVDLNQPHVWSFGGRRREWVDGYTDLLSAKHIDDNDLVVPIAATYALDPHILTRLTCQTALAPNVRGCEGFLASIGSVRGWLPLRGAHEMDDCHYGQSTRMLVLCCDARHPAWGSVAVVYIGARSFAMTWFAAEASLECLIRRWRAHPMRLENVRFAKDWFAWACVFYVDVGTRHEMDHVIEGHNEHAAILENMMEEDHAMSDKPWTWLLDEGEYDAFFAPEDTVDSMLDLDDDDHASQRHLRRWRKGRQRR